MIADSTGIIVVALTVIRRVDADAVGAEVVGTRVGIVTIHSRTGQALAAKTNISGSAGVAVVTRKLVVLVTAAAVGKADVVGARIVVIASQHPGPQALASGTLIVGGATVAIVAGERVGFVNAPRFRVATIISAYVAVVTTEQIRSRTIAFGASVSGGTSIAIIAGKGVRVEETARVRVA